MAQYTVRDGETLFDVCYNACGALTALSEIMTLNGFTTFAPTLVAGQVLEVPGTYNNDVVLIANKRPFNSQALQSDVVDSMIEALIEKISGTEKFFVLQNGAYVPFVVLNDGDFAVLK